MQEGFKILRVGSGRVESSQPDPIRPASWGGGKRRRSLKLFGKKNAHILENKVNTDRKSPPSSLVCFLLRSCRGCEMPFSLLLFLVVHPLPYYYNYSCISSYLERRTCTVSNLEATGEKQDATSPSSTLLQRTLIDKGVS